MKGISLKKLEADRADLQVQLMQAEEQVGLLRGALAYIQVKIRDCQPIKKE